MEEGDSYVHISVKNPFMHMSLVISTNEMILDGVCRHSTSSWSYQDKESFPDICWNKFSAAVSKSLTPNRLWSCKSLWHACTECDDDRFPLNRKRIEANGLAPASPINLEDSGLPKVCLKLSNGELVSSGYRAPVTVGFEFEVTRDSLRQRIPDNVQILRPLHVVEELL